MDEEPPGMAYTIPYEKQFNAESSRTCGAACLSMVYRSLGQEVPQAEIWQAIAKVNRFGSLASTTHLMVSDALNRGFDAVAIKVRHPIFTLRYLRDTNIRVILNHRLHQDAPTGHYSVMVDIGNHDVTLHDPYLGPGRRISHGELMQLWEPGKASEITGEVLIALSPPSTAAVTCEICQTPLPTAVPCPQCGKAVKLRPTAAIGCINEKCIARHCLCVCCPNCDFTWNLTTATPAAAQVAEVKPQKEADPFQLSKVCTAIDKFCATMMAIPLLASNPDLQKCLDSMKAGKGQLAEAAQQQLAMYKVQREKLAALLEKSKQAQEAHNKKLEELKTPSPPLDGKALGLALLKNTGLVRRTGLTEVMKL